MKKDTDVTEQILEVVGGFNLEDIEKYKDKILKNVNLCVYNEDKDLIAEIGFRNGKLHGRAVFYDCGLIIDEYYYKNGMKNGMSRSFDTCDEVQLSAICWQDDQYHGSSCEFSEDGRLISITNYDKGVLHGYFKFFEWDGTIYHDGQYKNGQYDGIHQYYDDNGDLEAIEAYADGKLISSKNLKEPTNTKQG